jgi:hypothetical protein
MNVHSHQNPLGRWLNDHILHRELAQTYEQFTGEPYSPIEQSADAPPGMPLAESSCLLEAGICSDRAACLLGESLCRQQEVPETVH